MTSFARLQDWYVSQCDGDWENSYGVSISTLDNPGWTVTIDLIETSLASCEFKTLSIERTEADWWFMKKDGLEFKIACGPRNLEEALGLFCDWADSCPVEEEAG
jgi:hypothetical protein